jgi:ABC-2 type transport system permease protein
MRLWSLIRKEVVEILRQREFLFLLLVVPLIETVLLGYVVAIDIRNVPVAVVATTDGPVARRIERRIAEDPAFRVVTATPAPAEPLDLLREGRAKAVVVLRDRVPDPGPAGGIPEVQIVIDGSEISTALYSDGTLRRIAAEAIADALPPAALPGLAVETRVRFNPGLRTIDSWGPGLVGLLLTVLTVLIGASTLARERDQQTIDTLRLSRLGSLRLVLGKGTPAVLAGAVGLILGLPLLVLWFRVPFRGSVAILILAALLYLVAASALALVISALASSHGQSMLLSWYVIIVAILLSGYFTPVESIPAGILLPRAIAAVNPFRYLMLVVRGVMLKGNGLADSARDLLSLAGLAFGYFALAGLVFHRVFRRR